MLTVTAQQSRFHQAVIEGSALKEVVVKDLSVAIGNQEILSHASFQLQVGKHYVLSGRNGTGKSSLLRAIATGQIPSIPRSLRVLLLGQTQVDSDIERLKLSDHNVLQHVVKSDSTRERLLRDERVLSAALDRVGEPTAAVQAYRQIVHERLEQQTHEARKIQLRRSGGRGAKAREALLDWERQLAESSHKLQEPLEEIDTAAVSEETNRATDLLTEIQSTLEIMGASAAEEKARSVLLGLGFSEESLDQPISQLSGGWKTRCSLACALCQPADLLLLDEPTNFLDLPSIIWLEGFIKSLESSVTVLVVSHDRAFADAVADELLVLRNLQLEHFKGNVSAYELERMKNWKYLSRMKEAKDKQKKHIEATIEQNVQAAKKAGDDKKLKQAASRKKKINERWGMEVSAKGTRFKLNRDLGGYHNSAREDIDVPKFDPPVRLTFPNSPADLRFPGALLSFENVTFSYAVGKRKLSVLRDINLTIHPGDRVGIAGRNGSGKTTLVSLAMAGMEGSSRSMTPSSGSITRHSRARFGLYSQQAVEELDALAVEKPEMSALSHLMDCGHNLAEKDARALLSSVGLTGKTASNVPMGLLSGGQKVRVALAKVLQTPPHLLILDEVTTHLDADTIEAMIHALRKYEGAILVVTHDRFFMRCMCEGESPRSLATDNRPEDGDEDEESEEDEQASPGVVYRLSNGRLRKLEGGMLRYEELAAKASMKMATA